MSTSDLDAWKALGPVLERFVEQCEARLRETCRWSASRMLDLAGVSADEPVRAHLAAAFVDLNDGDLVGSIDMGQLGLNARMDFRRLSVARELAETWTVTEEALEEGDDPWEMFWDSIESSSLPWPLEPPEAALQELAGLAREVAEAKKNRATTWPVFPTGETFEELLGETLAQVSARTGIPRSELPAVPAPSPLSELPMIRTDAAAALDDIHDWATEREDLARALGVVARWLRGRGALVTPSSGS